MITSDSPVQETSSYEETYLYYPEADEYDSGGYYLSARKRDQIIWFIATVLEILIGFRVFLKLIAANPQSGFASFIYGVTAPFLTPFVGLTTSPSANGSIFEFPSIIAMLVYALLFWLAIYAVRIIWGR